jgi:hypothetical protein
MNGGECDNKYMNNYLNGLTFENFYWKKRYNDLWQQFVYLQNENYRINTLLNEYNELNNISNENQTTYSTNSTTDNSINKELPNNHNAITLLQNKNNELSKTIMQKTKENSLLQHELQKYRKPFSQVNIDSQENITPNIQ